MSAVAESLYRRRRVANVVALVLSGAATLFGLFWLVWILWTTFSKGLASLNLALFTQMTPPPNEVGGMANAFFGSAVISLLAIAIGTPIGVAAG
ncbi:MAG TPA: phosphate ABC transporter, permease protein PstA, partial [Xanthomonadales bacterium]|nr:phosphate ABC transporter, permease protein PstA [Xanthomonadales bacterium]